MSEKIIITHIDNRNHFTRLLDNNPGLIIIKFGASWCRPCKLITPVVDAFYASSPDNILCCDIDIDECYDLYSYFKSKKMVSGVPTMLCYQKGNISYIPDELIMGTKALDINYFFKKCVQLYNTTNIRKNIKSVLTNNI